jgi:hypothetical protein
MHRLAIGIAVCLGWAWRTNAFVEVVPAGAAKVRSPRTGEEWEASPLKVIRPTALQPGTTVYVLLQPTFGYELETVDTVDASAAHLDGGSVPLDALLVDDCPGGMTGGEGAQRFAVCP